MLESEFFDDLLYKYIRKEVLVLLKSGSKIRVFDNTIAQKASFFTGGINDQVMEFDPFVSGYAFIIWTKLPTWLTAQYPGFKAMTQKNFTAFSGLENMEIQSLDYEHSFNGNSHRVNGGITKNNTGFTLTHKEYSGSPIGNMYKFWVSSISDPRTGIATYPAQFNIPYASKNHTGELLYIVTRPDANNVGDGTRNIEAAFYYTNVMPTTIQLDHMNFTLGSHETVDYQQNFTGTMHMSPAVDDFAVAKLKETYTFNAQGMFDPTAPRKAGNTIADFNTDNTGITGTGLGDI